MKLFEASLSVNITSILEKYSKIKTTYKNRLYECPICGGGAHTPCFGLYGTEKNNLTKFKCFSCDIQGDSIELVTQLFKINRIEAAKKICEDFNIKYDSENANSESSESYKKYVAVYNFAAGLCNFIYINTKHNYFQNRGLSDETIKEYSLGFCPKEIKTDKGMKTLQEIVEKKFGIGIRTIINLNMFINRYIIPIKNSKGDVVAFAGRSLDSNVPKYINSPDSEFFHKSYVLYNFNVACKYPSIIIVEGYLDALSLIEAGVPNVVATMGTALTQQHLTKIINKNLILAFDNDNAGRAQMAKIIYNNINIKFFVNQCSSTYKDYNEELIKNKTLKIGHAIPGVEWMIGFLMKNYHPETLNGRIKIWEVLSHIMGNKTQLNKFPINKSYNEIEYDYYWKKINRTLKGGRKK